SDDTCLLAVQGPKAVETLQRLTETDLSGIPFYHFEVGTLAGFNDVTLSATGYTGEEGFELYFNKDTVDPEAIWNAILEASEDSDIPACGMGARDRVRLEMVFALYGNDMTKDTHPMEARMGWLTKLDKGDFIGRDALLEIQEEDLNRKLVGFTIVDKRSIPRQGYAIFDGDNNEIGTVTSGTRSISLRENIGLGYVCIAFAKKEERILIEVRNKKEEVRIVKLTFLEK